MTIQECLTDATVKVMNIDRRKAVWELETALQQVFLLLNLSLCKSYKFFSCEKFLLYTKKIFHPQKCVLLCYTQTADCMHVCICVHI